MVNFKDYYKTLGVPRSADDKQIKAAYRRLARKYHPDMNPGDKQAEARFKELGEANEVLSDTSKRRRYDQLGANWDSLRHTPGRGRRPGRTRVDFGGQGPGNFSDFFRTFFEGAGTESFGNPIGQGAAASGGQDVEYPVELSLEEVKLGTTRTLEIGQGAFQRRVEVRIPPGVRTGSRVRVPASATGRQSGDLFLKVRVRSHSRFERNEADLQTTVKVPLTTAVLGGEVDVPTLDEDDVVGIKIPAGTPAGRVFRLKGRGLPRLDGGETGDLLASLGVELPTELDARERELFEKLRRLGH